MKKLKKNKIIFIMFLIIGMLYLPDAINNFNSANAIGGIKYLLISICIDIIAVVFLISKD